jgi:hypothetical protein
VDFIPVPIASGDNPVFVRNATGDWAIGTCTSPTFETGHTESSIRRLDDHCAGCFHKPSPGASGCTIHTAAFVIPNSVPSGLSTNPLTDKEEALIFWFYNRRVSSADITRVIASGHKEPIVEEVRPLQQLYNLNVPAEDINLIVGVIQGCGQ